MIRTQISLTEEQMARLRGLSRKSGTSIAALIRKAVEQTFSGDPTPTRVRRAVGTVGIGDSGQSDVSAHHDRYLADAFRE